MRTYTCLEFRKIEGSCFFFSWLYLFWFGSHQGKISLHLIIQLKQENRRRQVQKCKDIKAYGI